MEFFKDIFFAPFEMMREDDYLMKIVGLLVLVLYLAILAAILYGVFWVADNAYLPKKDAYGYVIKKTFYPAHTVASFIFVGKVMIPQTIYYPDNWEVDVKVDNDTDSIGVGENLFNTVQCGQKVFVSYINGRLSGNLYIKSIRGE